MLIGIDIGGTSTKIGLVDSGKVVARRILPVAMRMNSPSRMPWRKPPDN